MASSTDGPLVEDPGAHVEGLRGDLEAAGELLEDLRARLLQTPLDLAEVGVRDAGKLGELAQRQLRVLTLLPKEGAQIMQMVLQIRQLRAGQLAHASIVLALASKMQTADSVRPLTPPRAQSAWR
jgi:hypothetical protein